MSLKEHEYIRQTLERYTNCPLDQFCSHVLITNFRQYIKAFSERAGHGFRLKRRSTSIRLRS